MPTGKFARRVVAAATGTIFAAALTGSWHSLALAKAPRVVVRIAPIHSLVAGVMAGVGVPGLIVRGYGSPHHYQMRPSEAAALEAADLVFWVGRSLETFLVRPLSTLARKARIVELMGLDGLTRLGARRPDAWSGHRPGSDSAAPRPGRVVDPHIWLDAGNARRIVAEAIRRLGAVDPARRPIYESNGAALMRRIEAFDRELQRRLAPLREVPFVVVHDAFQYFERRYGLRAVGAVVAGPNRLPGVRALQTLRSTIIAVEARCVFREPQVDSGLVDTIVEGTGANRGVLDPLGARLTPGPDAYFEMMTANAAAMVDCLARGQRR